MQVVTLFVSRVLRLTVRARRDAEVARRPDALFADESSRNERRREAQELAELGINDNGVSAVL
jgi:hypothetical protein